MALKLEENMLIFFYMNIFLLALPQETALHCIWSSYQWVMYLFLEQLQAPVTDEERIPQYPILFSPP